MTRVDFLGMELLPFAATFLFCLFINMEYGILIGAGVHLILLAYLGNRPHPKIIRLPVNIKQLSLFLEKITQSKTDEMRER